MARAATVCRGLAIGLLLGLGNCTAPAATTGADRCAAARATPMLVFELFFGRSMPDHGAVSDSDWDAFRNEVITPAIPNGYTVFDADGAWMGPGKAQTMHEPAKVLLVALPDDADSQTAIGRIRRAYQVRFRQQLVGMTFTATCGAF